jgi:hypothetical protein
MNDLRIPPSTQASPAAPHFEEIDSESRVLYLEVPNEQVVLLQAHFELYEGLGVVRTVREKAAPESNLSGGNSSGDQSPDHGNQGSDPSSSAARTVLAVITTTTQSAVCLQALTALRHVVSWVALDPHEPRLAGVVLEGLERS